MAGSRVDNKPKTVQPSRSFSRMDSASASSPRKRASTLQERGITTMPDAKAWEALQRHDDNGKGTDVFESQDADDDEKARDDTGVPTPELRVPSTFDELPIEIKSLTERFLDSLSTKVHPQPLSADNLSELYQDFYERAAAVISTHIAALSSHLSQKDTPSRPKVRSRKGSTVRKESARSASSGGEMLTPTEFSDRKRARRLLELKRIALEETVERAVVENVYDRLWQHRSTNDEARDEKLKSRAAALSLVGIGLRELHMESDSKPDAVRNTKAEKETEIYQSLAPARESLQRMDDEHYPLGKLRHLTEAHKSIVEVLSELFPSSSADEILPTLIYTLINAPPEGTNAVSNLNFIQRFRAAGKVDGEAAYCLVNLEAAISFLETVDLSSLRSDEPPEGPPKSTSQLSTPTVEQEPVEKSDLAPARASTTTVTARSYGMNASDKATNNASDSMKAALVASQDLKPSRPTMAQRRLSSMVQAQADKLEASRHNFLNATDKIYDSINGSLENSLQFVFGRFKDNNAKGSPLPKTLEDARKLVNSPTAGDDDDVLNNSGGSSPALEDPLGNKFDGRLADLLGGRKQLRDRSVDSTRSIGSNKRVAFNEATTKDRTPAKEENPAAAAVAAGANLFATINPLNRLNVASFTRFARTTSTPLASPLPASEKENKLAETTESPSASEEVMSTATTISRSHDKSDLSASQDLNVREALAELRKTKPPKRRFLDVQSAADLKIGEVEELLMDYRRLAKAVGEAIAM